VVEDSDTGQTILSGMGELHLEVIISRMQREFNTCVNVGKPQVVYRESIENSSEAGAVFDKEVGGQKHFGEVVLTVKPLERGAGSRFRSDLPEETIPGMYIPAIEKSVMESLDSGPLMGYPVVDTEVILTGGSHKESLGSELALYGQRFNGPHQGPGGGDALPAGSLDERRSPGTRRFHGGCDRGSQRPRWKNRIHFTAQRCSGNQGLGSPGTYVRIFNLIAFRHPGPRHLHHAVFPLRPPRNNFAAVTESETCGFVRHSALLQVAGILS
jgi:hypothetical protein